MQQKVLDPVAVGTTATKLCTMDGGWVMLQNKGPNALTLRNETGGALGPEIEAGATVVLDRIRGTIFASCSVAQVSPADTRIFGDVY